MDTFELFSDQIVLLTYRQEHAGENDPELEALILWDTALGHTWETALQKVLPEFDLDPLDKDLKSFVMMLARFSNGTVTTKARRACQYYLNTLETIGGDVPG